MTVPAVLHSLIKQEHEANTSLKKIPIWDGSPVSKHKQQKEIFTPESQNGDIKAGIMPPRMSQPSTPTQHLPSMHSPFYNLGNAGNQGMVTSPTHHEFQSPTQQQNLHHGNLPVHHQHHHTHVQDIPLDKLDSGKSKQRYNPLHKGFGGQPVAPFNPASTSFEAKAAMATNNMGHAHFKENQTNFHSPTHGGQTFGNHQFQAQQGRPGEYNPLQMNYGQNIGTSPKEGLPHCHGSVSNQYNPLANPLANPLQSAGNELSPSQRGQQGPANSKKNPLMKVPTFDRRVEAGPKKK
jgi:hypothetical protein